MPVTIRVKNFQSIASAEVVVDHFTVITGTNNSGKALVHGTLVATPQGWVPVEAIQRGQVVLAGDGTPTRVLGVYPQGEKPVCSVLFDDGRRVLVDQGHQWQVSIGSRRFPKGGAPQRWEVLTTQQIRDRVGDTPSRFNRPAIPAAGPAGFLEARLPLDPYLMGVLLGDGSFRGTPRVSSKDDEVLVAVGDLVPGDVRLSKCGKYDYRLVTGRGHRNPVLTAIRNLGLEGNLSHQKQVPPVYLLAAPEQRLALLQGLLDTDGSVNQAGTAEFYSSSRQLAQDVQQIVWSFGGAARLRRKKINRYTHKGVSLRGRVSYTVTLRLPGVHLFRLARKAKLLGASVRRVQPLMVGFEDEGVHPCTCLSVEHPSNLFQIEGHIVTHNTALQRAVRGAFQNLGGTAFIREGETQCSVEVDFGKDGKVRWEKGTGKRDRPTYIINNGEPIYPGAAVPEEVAAFGVVPIQAGGQEVWPTVAPQFTGQIFLLDKPGSALAEAVADVERVGQLNRALRASESDKRQAAAALKVRQTDLAKQEVRLKSFEGLDEALEAVAGLDETRNQVITVGRAVLRLTGLRDRLAVAQTEVARLEPVGSIEVPDPEEAKKLLAELGVMQGLQVRMATASSVVDRLAPVGSIEFPDSEEAAKLLADLGILQNLQSRMAAAKSVVTKFEGLDEIQMGWDEGPSKKILAALDLLNGLQSRLHKAQQAVEDRQGELEQAEIELSQATVDTESLLTELGQCPTCGTHMQAGET